MKTISTSGRVLIIGTRRFPGTGKRDPWPSHAPDVPQVGMWNAQGRIYYVGLHGHTTDGSVWYWINSRIMNEFEAGDWIARSYDPYPPGMTGDCLGEFFNYVMRPTLDAKLNEDDFLWLLAHTGV